MNLLQALPLSLLPGSSNSNILGPPSSSPLPPAQCSRLVIICLFSPFSFGDFLIFYGWNVLSLLAFVGQREQFEGWTDMVINVLSRELVKCSTVWIICISNLEVKAAIRETLVFVVGLQQQVVLFGITFVWSGSKTRHRELGSFLPSSHMHGWSIWTTETLFWLKSHCHYVTLGSAKVLGALSPPPPP